MTKTPWLAFPLLVALVILPRISVDLYSPSLPNMGVSLHASVASLQMTMTTFMFGYAISMLVAGPLSDSIGRKKVMLSGLILFVVASLVCSFSPNVSFLIVARFFQALGGCCGTVIARVMVKDIHSKEDQINMLTRLSSAMAICPLIIPILGGTLQTYFGWQSIFYVLTLFSVVIFILGKNQIQETITQKTSLSIKNIFSNYKMLLTHRLFIGYSLAIGFAWCVYFSFTLESPFLIQKTLRESAIFFGMIFSLTIVGYLIGARLTKKYANFLGWDKLILIGTIISLIGAFILTGLFLSIHLNWEILVFPMMLTMCGVGIIIPCTQAAVTQPFPTIAGTASGLFFFIQMIFGGIDGIIIQHFRSDSAMPMAIIILFFSFCLFFSFYKIIWKNPKFKNI